MTPPYRVGVIGGGLQGTQHARAYQLDPRTEVVAVAEKDPEVLELFRRRFGLERGYTDYREMLANEQIDIAAPILPSTVIPEVVLASVEAGRQGCLLREERCASRSKRPTAWSKRANRNGVHFALGRRRAQLRLPVGSASSHRVRGRSARSGSPGHTAGWERFGEAGCQFLSVMRMFAWDAEVDWLTGWGRDRPVEQQRPGDGRQHSLQERHQQLHLHAAGRHAGIRGPVRRRLPVIRLATGPASSSVEPQVTKSSSPSPRVSTSAPTLTRTAGLAWRPARTTAPARSSTRWRRAPSRDAAARTCARSWRSSSPCGSPIAAATPKSRSPLKTAAWASCPRPRGRSARGAWERPPAYWPALMSQKPE